MSSHDHSRAEMTARRHDAQSCDVAATRDAGFTLPELLIAMMISGILIVSISMAFTTVLQTQSSATSRLAESKDITFVQTWLPVDLSSALQTFDMAPEAELLAALAAVQPASLAYTNAVAGVPLLPGTNVLTVIRPDLETGESYLVAYRYHQVGGEWQISRFEIRNPGKASQVVKSVGVAHEIPPPPAGWNWQTDQPTHAAEVLTRNGAVLRPVGEDVTVNFKSGNNFTTGGAGLSAQNQLPTGYTGGFINPSAPPSRCGGRIAVVVDTSGSVPAGNGGKQTENAVAGFIDAFSGTPTSISLNGFDREGYGMIWDTTKPAGVTRGSSNGVRAPFVSLLNNTVANPNPAVTTMRTRITDLDDLDGAWPGGGAAIALRDPNGDRIMWDQIGSGTNWEDGLWNIFRKENGTSYGLDQPDLVVFITDGDPNMVRNPTTGGATDVLAGIPNTTAARDAAQLGAATKAKAIADEGRKMGADVIGIMVGNSSNNTKFVGWLQQVVGPLVWDGSVSGPAANPTVVVGNAAQADLFKGGFDKLGGILKSIMIADCGGTVTVQKRIDRGAGLENPPSGVWSYTTDLGVTPLDVSKSSSVTFDYSFGGTTTSKEVKIFEQVATGYVFDRAECTAGGAPVTPAPQLNPDGKPGVAVTVQADQAVSCLMISRPA